MAHSSRCSLPDCAYVFDLSEHAEPRPMGLERDGTPCGHFVRWMGHELLYGEAIRRAKRHHRRRWVGTSVVIMLVRIVIERPI